MKHLLLITGLLSLTISFAQTENLTPKELILKSHFNKQQIQNACLDHFSFSCFDPAIQDANYLIFEEHVYNKVKHQFIKELLTNQNFTNYSAFISEEINSTLLFSGKFSCDQWKEYLSEIKKGDIAHSHTHKAAGDPCTNPDFEMCDFTNWELFTGNVPGNQPFSLNGVNPTNNYANINTTSTNLPGNDQHAIVSGGNDANGGFPMVNPSGSCSALLGDFEEPGANASIIQQTFQVSANDAVLILNYAVVLQDPNHNANQQPYFRVRVYDTQGGELSCGSYEAYAGDGQLGWQQGGGMSFLPWTTVMIPLDTYIGQDITVEFTVGDCSLGGHSGYAYVDAACQSLALTLSGLDDCEFPVTINAPVGAANYSWSTGATTSSIDVIAPGNYSVAIIPNAGPACASNLDTVVIDFNHPTVNAGPDVTICEGLSTVLQGSGTGVTTYAWNNAGSLNNANISTPTATPGATMVYTLTVEGDPGCFESDDVTVTVQPYQNATINPQGNLCDNSANVILTALNPGGTWAGPGIINANTGEFSPSIAGIGNHQINYSLAGLCPDNQNIMILVEAFLDPTISQVGPYCEDDVAVNLQAQSVGGIWAGTGITDPNNGTFDPSIAGPGVHNISYSTPGGCGGVDNINITVEAILYATINPQANLCDNSANIFMTAINPGGTWTGTGIVDANTGEFSPVIAGIGNHVITYSIVGLCSDSQITNVLVEQFLDPTITQAGPFCESDATFNLQAQSIGGVWAGPGIIDANNGAFDPSIAGPGIHNISYTTPGGCGGLDNINITVSAEVNADINLAGPFCHNEINQQLSAVSPNGIWSGQGIVDVNLGIFSPAGAGSGNHIITYTINGTCSDVDQISIEVYTPLDMTISNDTAICSYGAATICTSVSGGTGNYNMQWTNNLPQLLSHIVTPLNTTTYSVSFDDGCENIQKMVTVTIEEVPEPSFTADNLAGCVPFNTQLTNLSLPGSVQCEWSISNGFYANDCVNTNAIINEPGCYDVSLKLTTQLGCTDSITYNDFICGEDYPIATILANPTFMYTIDTEVDFVNLSSGAIYYDWNFGDGSLNSQEFEPTHNFPEDSSGIYTTTMIASTSFGCTDTATIAIEVKEDLIFYVPNTFTPDGSGVNELWKPVFHSGYDPFSLNLYIFNRWGELIWESHDTEGAWDGTYGVDGKVVKDGTYLWKMEFKEVDSDKHHTYTGHVNVLK